MPGKSEKDVIFEPIEPSETDFMVARIQDSLNREVYRSMGIPGALFDTPYKPESLTIEQIEKTFNLLRELKTTYYIARDYIPDRDEKGNKVYFRLAESIAKGWGVKSGLLFIVHTSLVEEAKTILEGEGWIVKEYDLEERHNNARLTWEWLGDMQRRYPVEEFKAQMFCEPWLEEEDE